MLIGHTQHAPYFLNYHMSKTVLTIELLRFATLISNRCGENLVWISRLHQKGAGEACRRAPSNVCTVDSVVLHRAWLCCRCITARLPTDMTTERARNLANIIL